MGSYFFGTGILQTTIYCCLFLCLLFLLVSLIVRLLPRAKEGSFKFPQDPQAISWLIRFSLQRFLYLPIWKPILMSFSFLRWSLFRSMGGEIKYNILTSVDAEIDDIYLMKIDEGCMLGSKVQMAGHFIENKQLILAKTKIGKNVQILSGAIIGPGCTIGNNSKIGLESRLLPNVQIGENVSIRSWCHIHSGASIGSGSKIGSRVVITAGLRIPENTTIPSDMIVNSEYIQQLT